MNKNIKEKIEEYVLEKFETLDNLDPNDDNYMSFESHTVKVVNTLIEALQKEDINIENSKIADEKNNNESKKIDYEYDLGKQKITMEIEKNQNSAKLEEKKVDNSYELDKEKLKNEITKIEYDRDINKTKIDCDMVKNKQDLMKINNEYEINLQKIEVENIKNKNNDVIENKKLKHMIKEDGRNFKLKTKELIMNIQNNDVINAERMLKVVIDGAAVIIPAVIYNVWMKRGFEFEENGTYTSNTFRNLFGRYKPTK